MKTEAHVISEDCLLQAQDLKPVREEINLKQLDDIQIGRMLRLGRDLTSTTSYAEVALNQFPPDLIKKYGLNPSLLNAVYISPKMENMPWADCLLINPKIIDQSDSWVYQVEACGSINHGRTHMWISRPSFITVSGIVYGEGWSYKLKFNTLFYAEGSGILSHEIDHLFGRTALNHTQNIYDFRPVADQTMWPGVWNWGQYNPSEELASISPEWLVFDSSLQKLIVVGPAGNYLRDFQP